MTPKYHKDLTLEKWQKLSFAEQMANIGSEVGRALRWRQKDKDQLKKKAFYRALELTDMTIQANVDYSPRLKELCRMREVLVDDFAGENQYGSSDTIWNKYFLAFNYLARKNT